MRISRDRPLEQAERQDCPLILVGGPKRYGTQIKVVGGGIARRSFDRTSDLGGLQCRLDNAATLIAT